MHHGGVHRRCTAVEMLCAKASVHLWFELFLKQTNDFGVLEFGVNIKNNMDPRKPSGHHASFDEQDRVTWSVMTSR
jgi:hypothetical protein